MDTLTMSDSERFALELHDLIGDLDPARWRRQVTESLRERLEEARDSAAQLAARVESEAVGEALQNIHQVISSALPDADAPARAWQPFQQRLATAYEELCRDLADHAIDVPNVRPTNHLRSVTHAVFACWAISVLWYFEDRTSLVLGMIPWIGFAAITETVRSRSPRFNAAIMRVFSPVAHPHEHHRINSATWYAGALFILAIADVDPASAIALATLGFGDPTAALVGRRFGRTTLINGRTLEGSAAFVVAGSLAAFVVVQLLYPALPMAPVVLACVVGSIAGAVAELISRRVDDNFSIPLTAAAAAALVFWVCGVL